jgi:hypothetical protein
MYQAGESAGTRGAARRQVRQPQRLVHAPSLDGSIPYAPMLTGQLQGYALPACAPQNPPATAWLRLVVYRGVLSALAAGQCTSPDCCDAGSS